MIAREVDAHGGCAQAWERLLQCLADGPLITAGAHACKQALFSYSLTSCWPAPASASTNRSPPLRSQQLNSSRVPEHPNRLLEKHSLLRYCFTSFFTHLGTVALNSMVWRSCGRAQRGAAGA